jgi:hypothetical protein
MVVPRGRCPDRGRESGSRGEREEDGDSESSSAIPVDEGHGAIVAGKC